MKQEISTEIKQELVKQALAARKFAYVPYSKFRVGAAVLAKNGAIYTGCNIENAAYTPTNCAERTAVFKAVSEGITEFDAIAVCGGPGEAEPEDFCTPCGVCRQVLREFVDPNEFLVLLCKGDGSWKEMEKVQADTESTVCPGLFCLIYEKLFTEISAHRSDRIPDAGTFCGPHRRA